MSHPAADDQTVEAMMAADNASRLLGIELVGFGPGWATTRMTVRADIANGYGIACGGLVFAVADTAFGCACNSRGEEIVAEFGGRSRQIRTQQT